MSEDIKGLLGKAFGPEPPLTVDRDAIVRRGRRQVRLRRLTASGGVAAAVVAVVLGAALLSNQPSDDGDLTAGVPASTTPAPTSTTPSDLAPAGPELPLTTTAPALVTNERHAAELTKALTGARILPGDFTVSPAEPNSKPLEFRFNGRGYWTTAQLSDGGGHGILTITVTPGGSPPKCPPHPSCTELNEAGVAMAARSDRNNSGTIEYSILALRPDGTSLTLIANNMASLRLDETRTTRPEPPVNLAQLRAIATLPGLNYR